MRLRPSLLLLGLLSLAGCAVRAPAQFGANPYPPPPPLREEVIPRPPVTEELLVWQPGHWDWVGSGYTWREGRYVPLAGHGTEFLFGHWSNQSGAWIWMPAHWL
jgi:hypothetical protein